ncbi:TIR domain-containing protein [Spirosoma validum]|uniref:Nucleotide-binding protein n=1 Tax=Spirosoma validum TaxID=2771355 RepID=A0A927B2C7_9BACT|nr:TIR domain-containing protein [Spirosoma validum]MBD2754311.1 nucleotide-binding protein [Spirosoma validum]
METTNLQMNKRRPKVFIGSSSKGLPVASAIQEGLYDYYEVDVWNQGVFGLMQVNIDALIEAGNDFDYAILILTPDDEVTSNSATTPSPRDNVIFEIGFFLGALGKEKTFIVHDRTANIKIPTDLAGLSFAKFAPVNNGNYTAALGPACNKIKLKIDEIENRQGPIDGVHLLVQSALQLVSKALTAPVDINVSKLRAFIFKKEDSILVCTHFWAPYPVIEVVGDLKFDINPLTVEQVAVVKAANKKRVIGVPVSPLSTEIDGVEGDVDEGLCFVLAAPILGPRGEVWGTVDFDASSEEGANLLRQPMAQNVIFELGKHLYMTLVNQKS